MEMVRALFSVKLREIARLTLFRIFIIEGSVTCFIALLAPLILVDWPEQCRFFSPEEKEIIRLRLLDDGGEFRMDTFDRHAFKRIALDWKIYLG